MSDNATPKYKRVLLKLSGEALAGGKESGLDIPTVESICRSIKKCVDVGAQIGIVVGGGNFWRGRSSEGMDRARADHIGMLATTMNALAVADVLENQGCTVRVQTAITMQQVAEPFILGKAIRHLEKGSGYLRLRHGKPFLFHRQRGFFESGGAGRGYSSQGDYGGRHIRQRPEKIPQRGQV